MGPLLSVFLTTATLGGSRAANSRNASKKSYVEWRSRQKKRFIGQERTLTYLGFSMHHFCSIYFAAKTKRGRSKWLLIRTGECE